MRFKSFLLAAVLTLTLAVSASAQLYVDGSNNPNLTTAVAVREWFKFHSGKIQDFPEIRLSPQGVQTVLNNLKTFHTRFDALVNAYNAKVEALNAVAERIQSSTYTADLPGLNASISALTTTTLNNINLQLSAEDALKFSSSIELQKKHIIASGTDPDLGADVAARNMKELHMIAHAHGMPQGGNPSMIPSYTAYESYRVGTMMSNGAFSTAPTNVFPTEIFNSYAAGDLHTVNPKWTLVTQGLYAGGGPGTLSIGTNPYGGPLLTNTVGTDNYGFYTYSPNNISAPYSNMCVSETVGVTFSNQFEVVARATTQGYGYILFPSFYNNYWTLQVVSAAHPGGLTLANGPIAVPQAGDTAMVCTIGTQISVYYNGTQLTNVTNTEVISGLPGIIGNIWSPSPGSFTAWAPKTLAQITQITGGTNCPYGCPTGAKHTPNVLSHTPSGRSIGGAQSGTPVLAASYINWSATTYYPYDSVDNPGGDNPPDFVIVPGVDCSVVGFLWGPPTTTADLPWHAEWATSFMYVSGPGTDITEPLDFLTSYVLGAIAFTPIYEYPLNSDCTAATTPPDFNPSFIVTANASQNTQYSFMMVVSICDELPIVGELADGLYSCAPGWVKHYYSPASAQTIYPQGAPCTYGFNGPKTPD